MQADDGSAGNNFRTKSLVLSHLTMFDDPVVNADLFDDGEEGDNERTERPAEDEVDADAPGTSRDSSTGKEKPVAPKLRIVRNPRPKLNAERLCGERGLQQLPTIFSNVSFKGKGHEKEDLDVMMKTLEHWSYRLFPYLPFKETLEKIETLGTKKPVQTYLKRIRLDMVVADDEIINRGDEEELAAEEENHAND